MKIRPVEAKWFHAEGKTDWRGINNSRFSQFCEKRLKYSVLKSKAHFWISLFFFYFQVQKFPPHFGDIFKLTDSGRGTLNKLQTYTIYVFPDFT